MQFTQAIVRTPCKKIIDGLTTTHQYGVINYQNALLQHQAYVNALTECGVEVSVLPALEDFPDSCFVEDPAVICSGMAILTRSGALSRRQESRVIKNELKPFFKEMISIESPGLLDGGDVLLIDGHYYIGLSDRTNQQGAEQLIELLQQKGLSGEVVNLKDMLHLKTGVAYIGKGTVLVAGEFINHPQFNQYQQIVVDENEAYCANAIAINDYLLLPHGFPNTQAKLIKAGFNIKTIDVSEFMKIDGGLSCLSLRF